MVTNEDDQELEMTSLNVNKKDPIIIGVDVTEGALRMTTPICAVKKNAVTGAKEIVNLGRV